MWGGKREELLEGIINGFREDSAVTGSGVGEWCRTDGVPVDKGLLAGG